MTMVLAASLPGLTFAQAAQSNIRQDEFSAAATEFGVPANILLALSYNQSLWQTNTGMSVDGGYGLMDLRAYAPSIVSGRDGSSVATPKKPANYYTLDTAASLLHLPAATLKSNQQQNIRGAAAVLAQDARQLHGGNLPGNINDWYDALAVFSGATDGMSASTFAGDVYATVKSGASATTEDGQRINLAALPTVSPNTNSLASLGLGTLPQTPNGTAKKAECPATLTCQFVPAAYAQDDPSDPTNYGNYDPAHRPQDMQIRYIFIHDGEGPYDSIIHHFQDPTAYDSAQYVISTRGDITQMVKNEDVSWGVGNWNLNMHGINIEHAGFAAQGASWYTPAMYQASATLVRWLAGKYDIPLDRAHILGHGDVMRGPAAGQAAQHWDPGPYWNWNYYMDLVRGETPEQASADFAHDQKLRKGDVITIAPNFATNQPPVTDCQTGTCISEPRQGANFVYLHTAPNERAPLLSDPYMHTDGSPGTTEDDDWGDKAPSGFDYVVADVHDNWTAIWYAGQEAWFYNPHGIDRVTRKDWSATLAPRPGLASIPVYTNAYPEASAYPAPVPVQPQGKAYVLPAGQVYATTGQTVNSDYYYDATVNRSLPDDHMIVRGNQRYYEISFNHHIGFVKTEDVVLE